jgi:hypothetical protein
MTIHNSSASELLLEEMQACLTLAEDTRTHEEADARYNQLRDRLIADESDSVAMLDLMWKSVLSGRRSSFFWQKMCDAEQKLTERMAESHVQLRQNHLRLLQEQ